MKTFTGILLSLLAAQLCPAQAGWCIPRQSGDSTTLFINGWRSTIEKDRIVVTRGKARQVFHFTDTVASQYYYYNRFIVRQQQLTGTWQQQDTLFTFTSDSTYTRQPGPVQGRYAVEGNSVVLIPAVQEQADRYNSWLEATQQGFILHLDNKNGTHYKLHKTP